MTGKELWDKFGGKEVEVISDRDGEVVGLIGVVTGVDGTYDDIDRYEHEDKMDVYDIAVRFDNNEFGGGHDGCGYLMYGSGGNESVDLNHWWLGINDIELINKDFIKF